MLVIGGLDYGVRSKDETNKNAGIEDKDKKGRGKREAAEYLVEHFGRSDVFGYLKGTGAEADSIGRIYPDADVTHRMEESLMKEVLPYYDMVHIATHGYSLTFGMRSRPEYLSDGVAIDKSLMGSGLALTGANSGIGSEGEDNILSAGEICEMDLSGVDFVVLSACQTAKGDISDEGAAGLVRGLKNAGAGTILATLWEVDDYSTMLFMQAFYKALREGKNRHEALAAARRRVREEETALPYRRFSAATMARDRKMTTKRLPPSESPYYWGAFIMID